MVMVTGARWLVTICLAQVPAPLISLSPVLALSDMDVNNIDIPDEKIDNTEENDNTGIKLCCIQMNYTGLHNVIQEVNFALKLDLVHYNKIKV